MSEDKGNTTAEAGTDAAAEQQQEQAHQEQPKAQRKTTRKKARRVKLRGRVNTTELAAGEVVEVERTPVIDKLLKSGFVEEIKE